MHASCASRDSIAIYSMRIEEIESQEKEEKAVSHDVANLRAAIAGIKHYLSERGAALSAKNLHL
jgi:hypothetical protein